MPVARSTTGAVATSHHLATEAGARMLRAGGSAVDAAIAAAATLCVVYPNNVTLGGDLVAVVRDPGGGLHFVNGTGRAPRAVDADALRGRHGRMLPGRGIDTVTVPGGVRGWSALARCGGRLGWDERLADAHRQARDGHPVAPSVARALAAEPSTLAADEGFRGVFFRGSRPLREGEILHQPALAETLSVLRREGPDAFYRGPLAERWVSGLRALGSAIDHVDVAQARATVGAPLQGRVLGYDVATSPPNTQGFALIRALREVDRRRLRDPLGEDAGTLAGIFASANRVRARWLSDPDTGWSGEQLIEAPDSGAEAVDQRPAGGDTVGLVAVDDDGWAVSLVQSVYWAFGSGVLEPQTGVVFQNRGTAFSLDPGHPAALVGGARPPHTLMPVLVMRDGRLVFANATMGGQAQAQIHTHLLLRLHAGASAAEATHAPRWVVGPQEDGDRSATLVVEEDVASSAIRALRATPFEPRIVPALSEALGHSNVIRADAEGWDAASDPRSSGTAIVVRGAARLDSLAE